VQVNLKLSVTCWVTVIMALLTGGGCFRRKHYGVCGSFREIADRRRTEIRQFPITSTAAAAATGTVASGTNGATNQPSGRNITTVPGAIERDCERCGIEVITRKSDDLVPGLINVWI